MIVNVISGQSSGYTNPNPFPGMSLAEACGMLQAYTSDALNEMNMSILLNEHAYLLENGTEIEYVNEANLQLKEKIKSAVDKVTKSVSDLWDKLVKWVQDRVEDVREKFNRISINKKKCQDIIKNWKSDSTFSHTISSYVDKDALRSSVDVFQTANNIDSATIKLAGSIDLSKSDVAKHFSNKIIKKNYEIVIDNIALQEAFDVVYETDRSILNDIRKAKAAAIKALNDLKKDVKENDSDDKSEKLKDINKSMRLVSMISSELIKLYHQYVGNNVEILHFATRNKSINKDNNKTNLDNDKKLKNALSAKGNKMGIGLKGAIQRYADGDTDYSRETLEYEGYLKESSSIFSGDRFFPIY